jgi:hypothetical protein
MTSCEGVRLPREHWEQGFHGPRGGIDDSVMENGMENVPPGGHQSTVDLGKHFLCRFALFTIDDHSSFDEFLAMPAAPAVPTLSVRFTPIDLSTPYHTTDIVTGMYADDEWDVVEVPHGPVNPLWRNTVIEFAVTRQYDVVKFEQSYVENEQRLRVYQRRVQQAINLSQGPRTFKACVDMAATYCAVGLCSGRAQAIAGQFLDKNRRLPTKRELFYLLDEDVYALYTARVSSSEETISSQESFLSEEVSSVLPGHLWIPSYV